MAVEIGLVDLGRSLGIALAGPQDRAGVRGKANALGIDGAGGKALSLGIEKLMGRDDIEPGDLAAIQRQPDRIKARRTILRPIVGDGVEDVVLIEPGNAAKRHPVQHQFGRKNNLVDKHRLLGSLGKGRQSE